MSGNGKRGTVCSSDCALKLENGLRGLERITQSMTH